MDRLLEIYALLTEDKRAELTDAEVGELHEELTQLFGAIRKGEVEGIASDAVDVFAEMGEAIKTLREMADTRITDALETMARIDAIAAEFEVDPPAAVVDEGATTTATVEDPADPATDPAAAVVDAAAAAVVTAVEAATGAELATDDTTDATVTDPPARAVTDRMAAARDRIQTLARTQPRSASPIDIAQDFIRSAPEGKPIAFTDVADLMVRARRSMGKTPEGFSEKITMAKMKTANRPDSMILDGDEKDTIAKILAVTADATDRERWADKAVVASGGWCAPSETLYDFMNISQSDRPFIASLPSFGTTRGGIRYAPPTKLSAVTTSTDGTAGSAVTRLTEAQDIAGTPTKPHQTIPCPSFVDVRVEIITKILQFGNLEVMAWPELVRHWNELVMAAYARMTESLLLTKIGAGSTQVTGGPSTYGAIPTMLSQLNRAATGMRNRWRMDPSARLRTVLPQWIVGLFQDDLGFRGYEGSELFGLDEAEIRSWFDKRNLNVTFHIDGETSGGVTGQIMGAQGAAPVLSWPDVVISYLYPEGSWIHLDQGELDLGIVRDSTLNNSNDFQIFSESFENVAFVGWESQRITHTLNASGAAAGVVTPVNAGS